ncbi:MAG: hypothetical protein AAF658_21935, partial [Myxococcota bacterium]
MQPTVGLGGDRNVDHNDSLFLFASFSTDDPGFGMGSEWTREWQIVAASAGCDVSDATLSNAQQSAVSSNITFTPPSSLGTIGCVYTVRFTLAGGVFAESNVTVINERPVISEIEGATFDGTSWRMQVPTGSVQTATAFYNSREADTDVIFDWSGAGASVLNCASSGGATPCETSTGTRPFVSSHVILAPTSAGTAVITVSVRDSFDGVRFEVPLVIEFVDCLWVAETGSSSGGATPGDPLDDLDEAINVAAAGSLDVCIVGSATLAKNSNALPTGPSLFGGFDSSGSPSTDRPTVTLNSVDGLTFSAGSNATIGGVRLVNTTSSTAPRVVTIRDASPTLLNTFVDVPGTDGSIGIDINA